VHLPIGVDVLQVPREHLGALLDALGLFEGVVGLDGPEVERLGVVGVVGVDRRDLVSLFEERYPLDVGELRHRVEQ